MKFTIDRDPLAGAAARVSKHLTNKPPIPVLAGVMLRVDGDNLHVSGFDYEVSVTAVMPVTGASAGSALVSARLLAEITKALPDKPITVSEVGAQVELVCGSARFALPTMPVEDYPALPAMPDSSGIVDAARFAAAVTQVAVAADRTESLPMMTGVRVEFDGNTITMLATDRYRLAMRQIEWSPADPGINTQVLVPAATLRDTAKALAAGGGAVSIAYNGDPAANGGMIGFASGQSTTTTRLLDGANYPPVRSLFPATYNAEAVLPVAALIEVVKRVALVAERTTPVVLNFTADGLVVEAGGGEEARASEDMDGVKFDGEPLVMAFNPQYLIDGLQNLGAAYARLSIVDAFKPAVITPVVDGGEQPAYRYLIMPIRVTR